MSSPESKHKALNSIWLLMVVLILFSSCSLEKRLYNRGFHIEWHKAPFKKTKSTPKEQFKPTQRIDNSSIDDEQDREESFSASANSDTLDEKLLVQPELASVPVEQQRTEPVNHSKRMDRERLLVKKKVKWHRQNTSTRDKIIGGMFVLLAILCALVCVLLLHAPTASFLAFIGGIFLFLVAIISGFFFLFLAVKFLFSGSKKNADHNKRQVNTGEAFHTNVKKRVVAFSGVHPQQMAVCKHRIPFSQWNKNTKVSLVVLLFGTFFSAMGLVMIFGSLGFIVNFAGGIFVMLGSLLFLVGVISLPINLSAQKKQRLNIDQPKHEKEKKVYTKTQKTVRTLVLLSSILVAFVCFLIINNR